MTATRAFHPHIVLMFDFDYTLASDSLTTLLEVVGIEREQWSHDRVAPLARAGWDEILARGYAAIEAAKEAGQPLTAGILAEAGRRIEAFPGVEELFDHLRSTAASIDDGISVEFGVLSSGFADVMTEAALCRHFDRVWGSSFHCDDEGRVDFVKRTITHP